jgi:carboxymethylenebutenolidase
MPQVRGQPGPSRRHFLVNSLASGFAFAVRPVSAQTIHTTATGLAAGEVSIPVGDGEIPGYQARPGSGGLFPLVLVVQEIFGVHEHIRDICRRLAKSGYMAVAPELYARQGDVSSMQDIQEVIAKVVSRVPDKQVMADLDAAVAWAVSDGSADASRLAVTGFCWGGRVTWLYCAHNPRTRAGVAWYGRLVGQVSSLTPRHPVDVAAGLTVPVLGLYGGKDEGIPLDSVEQMRAGLEQGGSGSEIVVYPEAPHGFHADYRPSYRRDSAEDGWRRMLDWFRKHGVR